MVTSNFTFVLNHFSDTRIKPSHFASLKYACGLARYNINILTGNVIRMVFAFLSSHYLRNFSVVI